MLLGISQVHFSDAKKKVDGDQGPQLPCPGDQRSDAGQLGRRQGRVAHVRPGERSPATRRSSPTFPGRVRPQELRRLAKGLRQLAGQEPEGSTCCTEPEPGPVLPGGGEGERLQDTDAAGLPGGLGREHGEAAEEVRPQDRHPGRAHPQGPGGAGERQGGGQAPEVPGRRLRGLLHLRDG